MLREFEVDRIRSVLKEYFAVRTTKDYNTRHRLGKEFRKMIYGNIKAWSLSMGVELDGVILQWRDYSSPYHITELGVWKNGLGKQWSDKVVLVEEYNPITKEFDLLRVRTHKVTSDKNMLHPYEDELLHFATEFFAEIFKDLNAIETNS